MPDENEQKEEGQKWIDVLEEHATDIGSGIAVVLGNSEKIVDALFSIIDKLRGLIENDDDFIARNLILKLSNAEINALTNDVLYGATSSLLEHSTGDDDEEALVRLASALECDRLKGEFWTQYGSRIVADVHGEAFDRLQVNLLRCNLSEWEDLDDDQALIFVTKSTPAQISVLPLPTIKILIRAMFDGFTGGDEERAITKLIRYSETATVKNLLSQNGFSLEDFDSEVDGDEWVKLLSEFKKHGISVEAHV